jgi:hypothetical protein
MHWMNKGWVLRVLVGQEFSLPPVVQTGSGANPAFYPMSTVGCFPRGKATGVSTCTPLTFTLPFSCALSSISRNVTNSVELKYKRLKLGGGHAYDRSSD